MTTDISQIAGGVQHEEDPVVVRARVTRAPENETDSMEVLLEGESLQYTHPIPSGHWTPRGGALPAVGDDCVVELDTRGDGWVTCWVGVAAPINEPPSGPASGDLSGSYPSPEVTGLSGRSVVTDAPTNGQGLLWNGTSWAPTSLPTTLPPSGPAAGDLAGTYPNPTLAAGAAANNLGAAGGDLSGSYPNPTLAAGVAARNLGTAGGDLSGTYPNPTVHARLNPISGAANYVAKPWDFVIGGTPIYLPDTPPVGTQVGCHANATINASGSNQLYRNGVISTSTTMYGAGTIIWEYTGTYWRVIADTGPYGAAGGDLAGAYPNPTVADVTPANVINTRASLNLWRPSRGWPNASAAVTTGPVWGAATNILYDPDARFSGGWWYPPAGCTYALAGATCGWTAAYSFDGYLQLCNNASTVIEQMTMTLSMAATAYNGFTASFPFPVASGSAYCWRMHWSGTLGGGVSFWAGQWDMVWFWALA